MAGAEAGGNALVAAHVGQFPGLFQPQSYNLLQASLSMKTEASLISTMAFIVCKQFKTGRFIDAKSKQIMVNSFCFTSWISDPSSYEGKLPADLRRVLRPDDEHDIPMNEDDARNFMLKFFGAVTEPAIATWLKARFEELYEEMENEQYGPLKLTKKNLFKMFVKYTLDKLQHNVVPVDEDILLTWTDQIDELKLKLKTDIADAAMREMQRTMLSLQQQQRTGHLHTRPSADSGGKIESSPPHQPASRTAYSADYLPGGRLAPQQPPYPFPDKPPDFVYEGQPCVN